MISENARNYENVVIRNEQEVGINNFGLNYLVSLEQEIERLNKERDLHCDFNNYLLGKIEKAGKEIKRLHSIIKEVREYIEENTRIGGINKDKRYFKSPSQSIDILEILDKEKDNE